jgi:hypothetical protein
MRSLGDWVSMNKHCRDPLHALAFPKKMRIIHWSAKNGESPELQARLSGKANFQQAQERIIPDA